MVAICRVLEVVEIETLGFVMSRGGLINFSESENSANKPYNHNHICIIYHLVIGAKGYPQTVVYSCTTQLFYCCQYQISIFFLPNEFKFSLLFYQALLVGWAPHRRKEISFMIPWA